MKLITALAAAVAISAATPAHALIFQFTVVGDASHPGTFAGTIYGLNDNAANQPADNITLFNSTIGFNTPFPYDAASDATTNSFTVNNGVVTAANLFASRVFAPQDSYALTLTAPSNGLPGVNSLAIQVPGFPNGLVSNSAGLTGITFQPQVGSASVAEPSTLALLGAALLSLPLIRRTQR